MERKKSVSQLDLITIDTIAKLRAIPYSYILLPQEFRLRHSNEDFEINFLGIVIGISSHEVAIREIASNLSTLTVPRGKQSKHIYARSIVAGAKEISNIPLQSTRFRSAYERVISDWFVPDARGVVSKVGENLNKVIQPDERERIVAVVNSYKDERFEAIRDIHMLEGIVNRLNDYLIRGKPNIQRGQSVSNMIDNLKARISLLRNVHEVTHTSADLEELRIENARLINLVRATQEATVHRFMSGFMADKVVKAREDYASLKDKKDRLGVTLTPFQQVVRSLQRDLTSKHTNPKFGLEGEVALTVTISINGGIETVTGSGIISKIAGARIVRVTKLTDKYRPVEVGALPQFDGDELIVDTDSGLPVMLPLIAVKDHKGNWGTIVSTVGIKKTLNPNHFQ